MAKRPTDVTGHRPLGGGWLPHDLPTLALRTRSLTLWTSSNTKQVLDEAELGVGFIASGIEIIDTDLMIRFWYG